MLIFIYHDIEIAFKSSNALQRRAQSASYFNILGIFILSLTNQLSNQTANSVIALVFAVGSVALTFYIPPYVRVDI
jgi:hypothetical protein